ncbi:MAG TPA: PepSY-associated TM helix domain-containing protein [Cyclobacteriaceae bacterium]|nr:PepSY-associated TM helix domain-containing protein [Cyclobacteriaceae bacterium]
MKRDFPFWIRWAHIYLSMFSFVLILFFAVTGITLNHPDALSGKTRTVKYSGQVNGSWIKTEESIQVSKLEMVEYFRSTYGITAGFSDFLLDDSQAMISFKGPGYTADAFIDRITGEFELTTTSSGFIAVMNDLHKGRDTGSAWKWLIDAAAVLMIIVSLSGLTMIFFIRYRRAAGLWVLLIGGAVGMGMWWIAG